MGARCSAPELQQSAGEPEQDGGLFYTTQKSGNPITTQVATIDEFPSVASYYSLDRWLHYSVAVKPGGESWFASMGGTLANGFNLKPITGYHFLCLQ